MKDTLMHYGRAKADGAPGVGTGNWRRSRAVSMADIVKRGKAFKPTNDYVVKPGSTYYRITNNPKEEFNTRMYVSGRHQSYWEDFKESDYVVEYTNDEPLLIAGKKTVDRILSEIGAKPMDMGRRLNEYGRFYLTEEAGGTSPDFMLKDSETRRSFIEKLKKAGYSGMLDPCDSMFGLECSPTATILIDDLLRRKGDTKLSMLIESNRALRSQEKTKQGS